MPCSPTLTSTGSPGTSRIAAKVTNINATKVGSVNAIRRMRNLITLLFPSAAALLQVGAGEFVPAERRDLVAGEIGLGDLIDDRMRDGEPDGLIMRDGLHLLIELRALLLVGRLARFLEFVLIGLVAEARDVLPAVTRRVAAEEEEEIVGVAIVARPAKLAGHRLALLETLAILAPFIGDELGVDADLGEIGLHHLADALRIRVVRPLHRHIPKIDVERGGDARFLEERLRLLGIVRIVLDL